ncbi:MAG: diaminopimelate epimerase [Gemmatimonadota bacterium]
MRSSNGSGTGAEGGDVGGAPGGSTSDPGRPGARPAGAGADYFKGHGLGNDYLVFEGASEAASGLASVAAGDPAPNPLSNRAWTLTPSAIGRVCDRWRGVGSDGIVVRLPDAGAQANEGRVFRLRMFNPDGSEFERSGNGLRILAAYLASRGEVGSEPFTVEVGGSRLPLRVLGREPGGVYDVSVGMGTAGLRDEDVELDRARLEADATLPLEPGGFRTVSVGNPHCVVFTEDHSETALAAIGPRVATHPAFRNGTNVQLARRTGENRIRIAIWERGVGRTSASGTSSCASAVAAVREGLVPPGEVVVEMEGGTLFVTVTEALDVTLRGPVQEIGTGTLAQGFLEALRAM